MEVSVSPDAKDPAAEGSVSLVKGGFDAHEDHKNNTHVIK